MEEPVPQDEWDSASSDTSESILEKLFAPRLNLFDTSHPAFKSAFLVLCDQVWIYSVYSFASSIFFPFRLEAARWILDSVFQPWLRLPIIGTYSLTAVGIWGVATREHEYMNDFDRANSLRIRPGLRDFIILVSTSISYMSGIAFFNRNSKFYWSVLERVKRFISSAYVLPFGITALSVMVVPSWRSIASSAVRQIHLLLNKLVLLPMFMLRPSAWLLGNFLATTEYCRSRLRLQLSRRIIKIGSLKEEESYAYKPMDGGAHEFRVLKIQTGLFDIRCSVLGVSPLEGPIPIYETISWTWDGVERPYALVVDGKLLPISNTMSDILRTLTPLWGTRYLWIDSICINQVDIDEKATQIPLMSQIYRRATRNIAYLGDAEDAHLVPDFVGRLDVAALQRLDPSYFQKTDPLDRFPFHEEAHNWRAYQQLLRHRFWSRIWIIQEMVLSRSITMLYGGRYTDWDVFARVALSFTTINATTGGSFLSMDDMFGGDRLSCLYGKMNVSFLAITRAAYSENNMVSLPQVLLETRGSGATDSRDRIYALEALDPLYQVPELKPDYTIGPRQLYTRVARHILSSGSFSLFGLAGLAHAPTMELPSWVPDFTTMPKMSTMHDTRCKYSVASDTNVVLDTAQEQDDTITLKGFILDRILEIDRNNYWSTILSLPEDIREEIIQRIMSDKEGTDLKPGLRRWLIAVIQMVENRLPNTLIQGYHWTDETLLEAILRTMIGNEDQSSFPASRETIEFLTKYACSLDPGLASMEGGTRRDLTAADNMSAINAGYLWLRKAAGRQFAITQSGYIALVPDFAKINDTICVFLGASVPYVIRESSEEGKSWQLVGETYVHGVMDGVSVLGRINDPSKIEWVTLC
jgi:hypothetical protein